MATMPDNVPEPPKRPPKRSMDLTQVSDADLFRECRRRYKQRREELGPYFAVKKIRPCKGCGIPYSVRDLRRHKCPSGLGWPKR